MEIESLNILRFLISVVFAGLIVFSSSSGPASAARTVDYATDIQPIFRSSCYSCHQGEKANAGLHLDLKASALAGGISGKAIVPGNGMDSLILKRVLASDPRVRMPLGGTPLPPEKIEHGSIKERFGPTRSER
jgi:hypothetical protein